MNGAVYPASNASALLPPASARAWLITLSFMAFLYPVTLGDSGIGANYGFVLLPLFTILIHGRFRRPPGALVAAMAIYTAIFIIAALYQYEFYADADRRIASYVLFMTMFAYVFISVDDMLVAAFKTAVVAMSLILTINSVYVFFGSGGSSLGYDAKDVVGTARIGFLYLMALWLLYSWTAKGTGATAVKLGSILLLVIGLLLTFSRTSILALVGSFGLFWLSKFRLWLRRPTFSGVVIAISAIAAVALAVFVVWALVPLAFEFFQDRIIDYVMDENTVEQDLANEHSTGGTRVFLWREIAAFVAANPLTGTGYLGVWTVVGEFSGSAHNQYADVLLRSGLPGFATYLLLLGAVLRYLRRIDYGLFWGFVAVLMYGMFHETFKETHGAFMLAFLVAMMAQRWRPGSLGGRRAGARA